MKLSMLFLVLCAAALFAADYYVDFTSGNDAQSGTAPASAWKHSPGDDNATGAAKSAALHAGDAVHFKGGTVYLGTVNIKSSGTQGQPIVYDGNADGTYGTGKAIIDGENTRFTGLSATVSGILGIIIRNFEIRNLKNSGNNTWGRGSGVAFNYCSYITVSDCYIHDVGSWGNDGSVMPAGCGVYMIGPKYCTVTRCEVTKSGEGGIGLNGAQNCVVSHNHLHDYINWGIDIAGDYATPTKNVISDNVLHDLYRYDTGYWGAAGDPPHQDYIFIRQGGGTKPVNNIIERNLCYNNATFTNSGGTAMTFLSSADSTIIRNNVYINPHSYYTVLADWGSNGTQFYNNIMYSPRCGAFHLGQLKGVNIRNNIVVANTGITMDYAADTVGMTCDYNFYYLVSASRLAESSSPSGSWSMTSWQARGYDTHGKKLSAISDFKFIDVSGYPLACETMDLHYLTGSPAIDVGANLGALCQNDKDSVTRPKGNATDVGAYEFLSRLALTLPSQTAVSALDLSVETAGPQGVNFSLSLPEGGAYLLSVYDIAGRKLWSKRGVGSAGMERVAWNPGASSGLVNGSYFARLMFQGKEVRKGFSLVK